MLFSSSELERATDEPALGFGQRSQVFAGISEQQDARHALGISSGEVANHSDDNVGAVLAVGAIDGSQPPGGVEIVLHEVARRKFAACVLPRGSEHLDDLVGVDLSPLADAHDFLIVFG